ncbi:Protein of unknown function [Methylobacterium phyllostachyos]|uniref:DUF2793 domain-containing protein n=1 Tax=Methylobacterium phyllostachyos TaxID=582672 RepID=A0A1H0CGL6_9HYPH|nr:DUF2793 domain-containing protein [Methylobacterium phyllostachyos]SDN57020.1 Protein of unknown function [Methylobacterium phyllostachyos]
MSDSTPHLGLPLIAASQAQKHVTHNEALGLLDTLVQLACLDKDLTAPPPSPAEGDRYLVVASSPGGAWAGLAGQVVRYADGVWIGAVPRAGWLAYVVDEADLYIFDGAAWTSVRRTLTAVQSLSRLGINTEADGSNRLAVKADAALLSWDDVTPGSGDMRVSVNKKAAARDAGFVFQTGYSARALFGTLGGDDVVLKTSPDGAAFSTALTASAATGVVAFAASPKAPTPAPGDASAQLATTAFVAARGLAFRNRLINGSFATNQRNASGAPLSYAADAYIMDRWKAGANGVTLSFATATNGDVTVTITAGSLVQVIEGGLSLPEGGAYTLSWRGTAGGRVYPPGASSPPAYAGPGSAGTMTAGSNAVVEFTAGTVSLAQLEPGGTATAFERRDDEMRRCQRYYQTGKLMLFRANVSGFFSGGVVPVRIARMRVVPTLGATIDGSGSFTGTISSIASTPEDIWFWFGATGAAGDYCPVAWTASAEL